MAPRPDAAVLAALGALAANAPWLLLSASAPGSRAAWGWTGTTIKCTLGNGVLCDGASEMVQGETCDPTCSSGEDAIFSNGATELSCPSSTCADVSSSTSPCTASEDSTWWDLCGYVSDDCQVNAVISDVTCPTPAPTPAPPTPSPTPAPPTPAPPADAAHARLTAGPTAWWLALAASGLLGAN